MNLRPIKDRVLVKQDEKQNKIGSLFVPQGSERYPDQGTVLAVGPDVKSELAVGDRVLFRRKADSYVGEVLDEEGVLMLPEDNILAVMEGGA